MSGTRKRRVERGFTLIEVVVVVAISAITASMFFGTHYAIHRQSKFITDSIRNRQDAQNALHRVNREMSEVTAIDSSNGNTLLIRRDYNYPRTPDTVDDDTLGRIEYDPATRTLVAIDDLDYPWPRTLAEDVDGFEIQLNGNLVTFEMTVRNGEDTGETKVRSSFVLRNVPH